MQTKLITLVVSLVASPSQLQLAVLGSNQLRPDALRSHIETQLTTHGEPLRWAITSIDPVSQSAHIEAVVTTP